MNRPDRFSSPDAHSASASRPSPAGLTRRALLGAGAGALLAFGGLAASPVPGSSARRLGRYNDGSGVLRVAATQQHGAPESTDPFTAGALAGWLNWALYDRPLRIGADGVSLEPGLAEAWEASGDGLTYTLKLREASFHNGTPVTADDLAFVAERIAADPAFAQMGWPALTVETVAPRTVRLRLDTPSALMPGLLARNEFAIVPRKPAEAQQALFWQQPIGSGPFVFASWEPGVEAVLTKNPAYWDAGKPLLDGLHFVRQEDAAARIAMLLDGEVDVATFVPGDRLDGLRSRAELAVRTDAQSTVHNLIVNARRPGFADPRVRQALNFAIDRDAVVAAGFGGLGEPARTFLPPGVLGFGAWTGGWIYDPDRASALVAAAGTAGFAGELLVPEAAAGWRAAAEVIAEHLSRIGGQITVVALPDEDLFPRVPAGEYDLLFNANFASDPADFASFFVTNGCCNLGGYQNAEIDALAAEALVTVDPAARAAIYGRIQELAHDDPPLVDLVYERVATAASGRVQNLALLPSRMVRWWEVKLGA